MALVWATRFFSFEIPDLVTKPMVNAPKQQARTYPMSFIFHLHKGSTPNFNTEMLLA